MPDQTFQIKLVRDGQAVKVHGREIVADVRPGGAFRLSFPDPFGPPNAGPVVRDYPDEVAVRAAINELEADFFAVRDANAARVADFRTKWVA